MGRERGILGRTRRYQRVMGRFVVFRWGFQFCQISKGKKELLKTLNIMRHFSDFIKELRLSDLPLFEGSFTWWGSQNSQSSSRGGPLFMSISNCASQAYF